MRYAFFANTPAHVHLYKHTVRRLQERGHDALVFGRDYACTQALLDYYELPYTIYGRTETTQESVFRQLPRQYATIFSRIRSYDPDLVFGIGGYAAHAGAMSRTPVVLVHDSEPTTLDHMVSKPFARYILTPHTFSKDLGPKHYTFHGFKETAYLHPDVYESDTDVRERLDIGDQPFYMVRFNAWGSHHDVGQGGFTPERRRELIERLSQRGVVLVSDESGEYDLQGLDARHYDLHPALLHDALAEAELLVADTQTMVTEAALLGTPAIRSNSWVGDDDMGNFVALEEAGLVRNIADAREAIDVASTLADDQSAGERWRRRRDEYLADHVNVTDLLVSVAENAGSVAGDPRVTPASSESHGDRLLDSDSRPT